MKYKKKILFLGVLLSVLLIVSGSFYVFGREWCFTKYNDMISLSYSAYSGVKSILLINGFAIRDIKIDGNVHINDSAVMSEVDMSEPILLLSLDGLRNRLKAKSGWIKDVVMQKHFQSGQLFIRIQEYTPFACIVLHSNGNSSKLVDENLHVIEGAQCNPSYPTIEYDSGIEDFDFVRITLLDQTELSKHITSMKRIGQRRWDLIFDNGLEVKLPQDDQYEAWARLIGLHARVDLIDNEWRVVDLRIPDRLIVKR